MSKMNENSIKSKEKPASLSSDSYPPTLRKRKKYKEFIRLIKNGELEYFYKVAKRIGVNRETISRWFYTKSAQKALDQSTEEFVNKLPKQRFTWRDHAKSLDITLRRLTKKSKIFI